MSFEDLQRLVSEMIEGKIIPEFKAFLEYEFVKNSKSISQEIRDKTRNQARKIKTKEDIDNFLKTCFDNGVKLDSYKKLIEQFNLEQLHKGISKKDFNKLEENIGKEETDKLLKERFDRPLTKEEIARAVKYLLGMIKNDIKEKELDQESALILKDKNFFGNICEEFKKKIVGEEASCKVIFLCANGRLIENCQVASYNLLVNDDAGTGKDYITDAVLDILPKEIYIHKTRISPAVFTYWHNPKFEPEWTWNGKVFYAEDMSESVLNSDVVKVMTSKGSSATIVIKQRAYEIDVKGKPVFITTTATAIPNPELTRRFVILNLDSSQNQTKLIMKRHSEFKTKGIIPEYNSKYTEAMRFLKPVKVKIPFAEQIDEHFPSQNVGMRTHYPRFLDFISAVAGFYQFQRRKDEQGFIIAEGQDYDIARECFLKLCSNRYMISLTINQKKIIETFDKIKGLKGSVVHLHKNMNFISERALQTNLQLLASYGIIDSDTEKDVWNRDITTYFLSGSYNPNEKIIIPTYEELCRNASIPSTSSISTKPSIPSIPKNNSKGSEGLEGSEREKGKNNANKSLAELEKEAGEDAQ